MSINVPALTKHNILKYRGKYITNLLYIHKICTLVHLNKNSSKIALTSSNILLSKCSIKYVRLKFEILCKHDLKSSKKLPLINALPLSYNLIIIHQSNFLLY